MLKPHKDDKNYADQMKKYEQDNSSWGIDHRKVDIMKSPLAQEPKPVTETNTNSGRR